MMLFVVRYNSIILSFGLPYSTMWGIIRFKSIQKRRYISFGAVVIVIVIVIIMVIPHRTVQYHRIPTNGDPKSKKKALHQ